MRKKEKRRKPVEIVTEKGQSIPVYYTPDTKDGKAYPSYTFVFIQAGARKRGRAPSLEKAVEKARDIARQLAGGTGHAFTLTPSQAADYQSAEKTLRAIPGVTLSEAVALFAQAVTLAGGVGNILPAVKSHMEQVKKLSLKEISVGDLVEEFLAAKKRDGLSVRYIAECRLILDKFKAAFRCNVGGIQTADLQAYIDRLKLQARSKRNHRGTIVALFSHARRRGYLPRDLSTEADHLDSPKERSGQIGIYTPDDLHKVIKHATGLNRLVVAIGAYAGLRSAEMHRLEWKDIGEKYVTVGADKSKTSERRVVPILPALAAVLAVTKRGEGKIFPHANATHFSRFITKTIEAAGVAPVKNGLRHSFCTYRLADVQSAAQVALEAGNSPKMLFQHYRELATKEEAAVWFESLPVAA